MESTARILLAAALMGGLVSAANAAFQVPGFELVYSYPVETSLEEPDLRGADAVWPEMFDDARRTIDVNEFYITPSTGGPLEASLQALERAGRRGVRIRFLLEKKMERVSLDGIARLLKIPNLELRILDWSRLQGDGINHAKYFIVDSTRAFVGSQNFDWRSLRHIHEMGLAVGDPGVVSQTQAVFDHDWAVADSTSAAAPDNARRPAADQAARAALVASPWRLNPSGVGDSESELARLIGEAKQELAIQVMEYSPLSFSKPRRLYPPIDEALRAAATRGVKIKLLVSHWSTEEPGVRYLQSLALIPNVDVRIITVPQAASGPIPFARVAHSKYMVVDGDILWLGTSNWAGGYLDNSRNLEIIVRDSALAARAAAVQRHLWDSPYSSPLELLKTYPAPRR